MTKPYSQDLRDRVLAGYDRGMETKQIATVFKISSSWARRVRQRRRETGETTHRRMGTPIVLKVDRSRLAELVREQPDATLAELRERLGIECGLSTISVVLKELGLSLKKRRFVPQNRIDLMWSKDATLGSPGPKSSIRVV